MAEMRTCDVVVY